MRTVKNCQRFAPRPEGSSLGIGPCQVAPEKSPVRIDQERQMAHQEAARAVGDDGGERVRRRVCQQRLAIFDPKRVG